MHRRWVLLVLLALLTVGSAGLWLAMSLGPGMTSDSATYLLAARSLYAGEGYRVHLDGLDPTPVTHFPPGYSLLVAGLRQTGLDESSAVKAVNLVSYWACVTLLFIILRQASTPPWLALFVTAVFALHPDVLSIYSMALSEPAFLALFLGGMTALFRLFAAPRGAAWLLAAALLYGLSATVRYAGLFFIGGACLSILLAAPRRPMERAKAALIFLSIALAPFLLLAFRNAATAAGGVNRTLAFHPVDVREALSLANTASQWIFPASFPIAVRGAGLALFTGLIVYVFVMSRQMWPRPLAAASLCHLAAYLAGLVVSLSFVDRSTPLDSRILVPALVLVVIALTSAAQPLPSPSKRVRFAATALFAAIAVRGVAFVADANRDGLAYSSRQWRESSTVAVARSLPPGTLIFSNAHDAISLLTSHAARPLPRLWESHHLGRNGRLNDDIQDFCAEATGARSAVLFSRLITWRSYFVDEARLVEQCGLQLVDEDRDSTLYSASR